MQPTFHYFFRSSRKVLRVNIQIQNHTIQTNANIFVNCCNYILSDDYDGTSCNIARGRLTGDNIKCDADDAIRN